MEYCCLGFVNLKFIVSIHACHWQWHCRNHQKEQNSYINNSNWRKCHFHYWYIILHDVSQTNFGGKMFLYCYLFIIAKDPWHTKNLVEFRFRIKQFISIEQNLFSCNGRWNCFSSHPFLGELLVGAPGSRIPSLMWNYVMTIHDKMLFVILAVVNFVKDLQHRRVVL